VKIINGKEGEGRILPLEDLVPGFRDGGSRIPECSVQIEEQQGIIAYHGMVLLGIRWEYYTMQKKKSKIRISNDREKGSPST
jgi:hypothetical protein